jgi:hypothetical protein
MQGGKSAGAELISVVRSYAEEWGSDNVLIAVPMEWEALGEALTVHERVRLAFTTNGKIEVSAFQKGIRKLHYAVDSHVIIEEAMREQQQQAA